jgi:alpha-mannosidase
MPLRDSRLGRHHRHPWDARLHGPEGCQLRARPRRLCPVAILAASMILSASAHTASAQDRKLYVVSLAHLDTQWRWTIQDTIRDYLPDTMYRQTALMDIYPGYVFSFEGAFRYALMKEYYPKDYENVRQHVARGQWAVAGASIDAGDPNMPSPESAIRHILYGNQFFQREFGKTSLDILLPDSFGFPYTLPSVAVHCGLKGFSTQKLAWGSSVGIPFDVGIWEGVDGSTILAALNPGVYAQPIENDLSTDPAWLDTINATGVKSGLYVGYKYFGVGDQGGAPDTDSLDWLTQAMKSTAGPVKVLSAASDQLFRDVSLEQGSGLPRYKGELLMTTHGTGCYTSQGYMKRWNRENEQLADAAERGSVIAQWLGGDPYPQDDLRTAWIRFLWHQFHDDLTGTSIPEAYRFSWNDELISLNQFGAVLQRAVSTVAQAMDTRAQGIPIVVFNPLSVEREDLVTVAVDFGESVPGAVQVFGPDSNPVPAQVAAAQGAVSEVTFLAQMPPEGFKVFDVRAAGSPVASSGELMVSEAGLENGRYRVTLDADGDLRSVVDKALGKELLGASAALQMFPDISEDWPAWEILKAAVSAPPKWVASGKSVKVLESGPARVTLEVTRRQDSSTFVQRFRLAAGGAGERLEIESDIDWRTRSMLLKAAFPLSVANPHATYDLGLGTVERSTNTIQKYEVPAHQWADITSQDGQYGVAVLSRDKYGWDKPDNSTLRLTLLHTPSASKRFVDQQTLDIGRHETRYALQGHAGDWRAGGVVGQAARLNQPLRAVRSDAHEGALGKSWSFLQTSSPQVMIKAVKKAEESQELVVRLQEIWGQAAQGVKVTFARPVTSAREVNGAEQPVGSASATVIAGALVADLGAYQPKAYAIRLAEAPVRFQGAPSQAVELPFDEDVVTTNENMDDGSFDDQGSSFPAELMPTALRVDGVDFQLGPSADGQNNALACSGQTITLPAGHDDLYLLAAAVGGDTKGTFAFGDTSRELGIQQISGVIGQWGREDAATFVKPDRVAWVATHLHSRSDGDQIYVFGYMFKYRLQIPSGATAVKLPDNEKIKVFAITAVTAPHVVAIDGGVAIDSGVAAEGGASDGGPEPASGATDPQVAGGGCACETDAGRDPASRWGGVILLGALAGAIGGVLRRRIR